MQSPLRVGDAVLADIEVLRVRATGRARWEVQVGAPPLTIYVERPREDCVYSASSGGWGLWVDGAFDDRAKAIVAALAERVAVSEAVAPPDPTGTLHLVPGHLGNPLDLSVRALQTLGSVSVVFVEPGKVSRAEQLLAGMLVTPGRVEELDAERLRSTLQAGEDAALFGVDEGIPGFVDPGFDLSRVERVRCVGGPSVLGTVLMRIPIPGWAFTFLGALHDRSNLLRVAPHVRSAHLPVILFSTGAGVRLIPELVGERRGRLHLLVSLTRPDERLISTSLPEIPSLPDPVPVVAVLDW